MSILCGAGFSFFQSYLPKIPGNYLEIGVYEGDSLRDLSSVVPSKRLFGVDPFIEDGYTSHATGNSRGGHNQTQQSITEKNLEGRNNVMLHKITSKEFSEGLTEAAAQHLDITAVLIDGSHHYEDVSLDFALAKKLIGNKPGVIVTDDICGVPDVLRAYREFLANNKDIITHEKQLQLGYIEYENMTPGNQVAAIFLNGGEKYDN